MAPRKGPSLQGASGLTAISKQLAPLVALADVWDDLTPAQQRDLVAKSLDLAALAKVIGLLTKVST